MKLFVLLGLICGFSVNAEEVATTETAAAVELETLCLTEALVTEMREAGWTCAVMLTEDGAEILDTMLCTMAVAEGEEAIADIMLTAAACETVETATE